MDKAAAAGSEHWCDSKAADDDDEGEYAAHSDDAVCAVSLFSGRSCQMGGSTGVPSSSDPCGKFTIRHTGLEVYGAFQINRLVVAHPCLKTQELIFHFSTTLLH